jgi:hypothetical protein
MDSYSILNEEKNLSDNKLKNGGLTILNDLFIKNDWTITVNLFNHICYSKIGFETESFEIKLDKTKIYVSIPLKNSPYQYKTSFNNYSSAFDYVEKRFLDFINDENNINTNQH